MKKNIGNYTFLITPLLAIGFIQFLVAIKINHPPTEEQLKIILPLLKFAFIRAPWLLWSLRTTSYLLLFFSLINFCRLSQRYFSAKTSLLAALTISLSPAFFSLWLLHPISSLAIFIFTLFANSYYCKRTFYIATLIFILLAINTGLNAKKAPIIALLNPQEAQQKVLERFREEDDLKEKINFPLIFRRISYNKYFFVYKNVAKETIKFFDLESIFFQETHPLGQKSFVIFFWPEIFLFALGLYQLVNNSTAKQKKYIAFLTAVAFLGFITTSGEAYKRFSFLLFSFSLITALGVKDIRPIALKTAVAFLIFYAVITNYYSLAKNYPFWFNNREIAYGFIFRSLAQTDLQKYQKIHVTGLIGNAEAYCDYYLKQCPKNRFSFDSFNLSSRAPQNKEIYAGFIGEFIGPRVDNVFPSDGIKKIKEKSLAPLYHARLRNSVAFHYGHQIIVAEKK